MDTDEAWESFIGIRKSSNKGYADTIAAALNDIKTDTSNLAKLTNKLLGEQGMMESAGGIDSPQSLAAQGAGEAGGMDMPAEDMTQDKGVLDDAMGMMDQRAGAGTPPMGGEMPPMEGGEDPGMMADMDEAAPPMEGGLGGTGDEGMAPEGMDGLGAEAGAGGEGDLPQAGGNFNTDCVQFLERAKEELQSAAGEGDYFKARKLIEIVTALNKILESDGNPDTLLKSDSAGEYQSASPITTQSIGKTDGEVDEEKNEDELTKSDAGEYESADPAPTGNVTSSEGERRGMATPKVDMFSKDDAEPVGDANMSEAPETTAPTDTIASSDSMGKACCDEGEETEVKKSAAPDKLPSFSEMLAYRKGLSDVDSYTAFAKSARKALQDEVDSFFHGPESIQKGWPRAPEDEGDSEMDALSDEERGRPDFMDYSTLAETDPVGAAGVPVGKYTMGRAGRTPGKRFINREATQLANEEGYDPMGPNADYSDALAEASLENDPISIDYDDPALEFEAEMDDYTGGNPDALEGVGGKVLDNWTASMTPKTRAAKQNVAGYEEAKKKSKLTGKDEPNKTPDRGESKETSGKPAKKLEKSDETYPTMKSAAPQGSIVDKIASMRKDKESYEASVTESFRKSSM